MPQERAHWASTLGAAMPHPLVGSALPQEPVDPNEPPQSWKNLLIKRAGTGVTSLLAPLDEPTMIWKSGERRSRNISSNRSGHLSSTSENMHAHMDSNST